MKTLLTVLAAISFYSCSTTMETMENNLIEKHGTRKRMKVDSAIVCREKLVCLPRQSCHEDCEKIKLCEEVTVVE